MNLTPSHARAQRRRLGLSQVAVATAAGISHPSVISNFENGRLRLSDDQIARLAAALDQTSGGADSSRSRAAAGGVSNAR
jgi:transcriptional regulator with XRE-family HTH domain